jgi:hypothetical protein
MAQDPAGDSAATTHVSPGSAAWCACMRYAASCGWVCAAPGAVLREFVRPRERVRVAANRAVACGTVTSSASLVPLRRLESKRVRRGTPLQRHPSHVCLQNVAVVVDALPSHGGGCPGRGRVGCAARRRSGPDRAVRLRRSDGRLPHRLHPGGKGRTGEGGGGWFHDARPHAARSLARPRPVHGAARHLQHRPGHAEHRLPRGALRCQLHVRTGAPTGQEREGGGEGGGLHVAAAAAVWLPFSAPLPWFVRRRTWWRRPTTTTVPTTTCPRGWSPWCTHSRAT